MSFLLLARWLGALCLLAGSLTDAAPTRAGSQKRAANGTETGPLVFCHFMIGIVGERTSAADYDGDMQRAKSIGIDAFALNIGVDPYTDTQLGYAYDSAAANDMKVFISFDFNWWNPASDAAKVGQMIAKYGSKKGQLIVDGKVFASSFAGDGLDVPTMRASASVEIFWAPNFHPELTPDPKDIDAALNWMAWDSNGNNKAPNAAGNVTVADGDSTYVNWLAGKPYIAAASPWFSTHFGPEVPYSKNWVFPGDRLWYERWHEIIALQPRFVEIVTWNDYGESHYIGPLSSTHYDDGNSKWTNDMPHDGWLDMAAPFIAAYKAGSSGVTDHITNDQLIYWHRPHAKSVDCDATDTTMVAANNGSGNYFQGRPDGYESMQDNIFVVSLLTAPGTVTVTSGGNTQSFDAPAGASIFEVAMGVGQQQFALTRDAKEVFSGTSLKEVTDDCICGLYNFNAYVGSLPEIPYEPLNKDGLASLTAGLHVTTCSAAPSLGNGSAPTANPTVTGGSGTRPTTSKGAGTSVSKTTFVTSGPTKTSAPSGNYTATSTSRTTPSAPTGTTSSSPQTSAAAGQSNPSGTCTAGSTAPGLSGNYDGLCAFACSQGYCPPDQCVCTAYGSPAVIAEDVGAVGCPLPGENESYLGLCKFSCARGYCPETACSTSC